MLATLNARQSLRKIVDGPGNKGTMSSLVFYISANQNRDSHDGVGAYRLRHLAQQAGVKEDDNDNDIHFLNQKVRLQLLLLTFAVY